jgi:hypothetical protein
VYVRWVHAALMDAMLLVAAVANSSAIDLALIDKIQIKRYHKFVVFDIDKYKKVLRRAYTQPLHTIHINQAHTCSCPFMSTTKLPT